MLSLRLFKLVASVLFNKTDDASLDFIFILLFKLLFGLASLLLSGLSTLDLDNADFNLILLDLKLEIEEDREVFEEDNEELVFDNDDAETFNLALLLLVNIVLVSTLGTILTLVSSLLFFL